MNIQEFQDKIQKFPEEIRKNALGSIASFQPERKDNELMQKVIALRDEAKDKNILSVASILDLIILHWGLDLLPGFVVSIIETNEQFIEIGDWVKELRDNNSLSLPILKTIYNFNQSSPSEKKDEFVYVMLNRRNGFFKIGYSTQPEFRERTLQSEEPEIEMILFFPGTLKDEKELHRKYSSYRKRGEWFSINETHIEEIKSLYKHRGLTFSKDK